MLFDSSVITISLYEGQALILGKIALGYVYAISAIKAAPPSPHRLLQSIRLKPINSSD